MLHDKDRLFLTLRMAFLLGLVAMGGVSRLQAQAPTPARQLLDKETFFEMESVSSPEISPDGKWIVFTRTWVDKAKDESRSNLWLVDVAGTRVRELTSGPQRDSAPVWSPDGKRLAFLSDRDGTTQLHVLWLDTREVAQLTHLATPPANVAWSPDGSQLGFTGFVPTRIRSWRSVCRSGRVARSGQSQQWWSIVSAGPLTDAARFRKGTRTSIRSTRPSAGRPAR